MPIPLLRFPLLVLDEVIKTMGLQQLFRFSLCSKRMHLVAKNLGGRSMELGLWLSGSDDSVSFFLDEKNKSIRLLNLRGRARTKPQLESWTVDKCRGAVFQEDKYGLNCYWEDIEKGTRCFVEHICDLFGVLVNRVDLEGNHIWMLDLVEQRQGPRTYKACSISFNDEQYRHVVVDLNPTSLSIASEPSDQFRIDNFYKTYDDLTLHSGYWVTVENLFTLDCAQLVILEGSFTVPEINRFLRHVLVDGGAPRLIDFFVPVEDSDADDILEGLWDVLTPIPGKEQFQTNGLVWDFSGMMERGGQSVMVIITCGFTQMLDLKFHYE